MSRNTRDLARSFWKAMLFILMLIIGGVAGYFAGRMAIGQEGEVSMPISFKLALLPVALVLWFLAVGVHEMGHIAAGRSVGFSFRMLILGPFLWEREDGQLRFRWNRNLNLAGGMALMLPPDNVGLRRRFVGFTAGGPLASLLLGVLLLGIAFALPAATSAGGQFLLYLFKIGGVLSLIILLATIIPMRAGGFLTDGARILQLLRGGPAAELDVLVLGLVAQVRSGLRPRDFDLELLAHGLTLGSASAFTATIHHYLYLAFLDRDEPDRAEPHLQEVMALREHFPKAYHGAFWLEEAFFAGFYRRDAGRARLAFSQYQPTAVIPSVDVLRAEAALALAEGDPVLAAQKAEAAIPELPRLMETGKIPLYRHWLEQIRDTAA